MQDTFRDRHRLENEWERAIERADHELEPEAWNDAAGVHIQSGVKGGGWTNSCSCLQTCSCDCPP